ncbi:MAG: HYR domain-containing protein [Bacteroidales bacterium]|nr:HYR domain-containing protein [Bacteroidales bacterium]
MFNLGTTNVVWTITDGSGNTATCSYNVVVVDTQNPTITCATPATNYAADAGICTYLVTGTALDPLSTGDNCSILSVVNDKTGTSTLQGAVFSLGTTNVVWTITDGSGNTATCSYNVVVVDTQNPTITCATPATNYAADAGVCTYSVPGTALDPQLVNDNCSIASVVNNKTGTSTLQGAEFALGTTNVVWTITDGSGNTATCNYNVVVVDSQNPTISCATPAANYAADAGVCTYTVLGTILDPISTGDNCSIASVVNTKTGTSTLQNAVFALGTTNVVWTITDGSGNTATCSYDVVVIDSQNPTITCPASIVVNTNSGCSASSIDIGTPTVGDNCSIFSVTNDHPSTTYPLGTTTVTWTVTDGSGNTATCLQTVTVNGLTVSGNFTYYNPDASYPVLSNINVELWQGGVPVYGPVTTNASGQYSFSNVCSGTYDVVATTTKPTAGALNSTDAAQVNYWGVFGNAYSIEKVRFYTGDGAMDNSLDAADASRILKYFTTSGASGLV